ncbi:coiled-coil domain-containing protein 9 isoform X3 [Archocentrus centrarchus]|uniref:coiled-coil domain-containing protein 9 isoform X3 n=1 Tax=Archocentrus centrarchus TaxID=63155 RepID=UPI0011EA3E56|nr:coiled-coil domain-containing protein 9 isoform X3 [Archocentrus centrarchus]
MSSTVDLKTKEEKDAELDKRIEALRKKNEALMKRYQEIEEDKKKAEQEGIAVTTPRKPRPHEPKTEKENITVTLDLSKAAGEKRVVNDWKPATPRGRKTSEESEGHRGQSDGHSPPRRTGSGRMGRGGQRGGGGGGGGGRQDRRDREPRTPRDGEPGEPGGPGRRGGRRGRGGEGTPGGVDRKSKEWEEKRRQNIEKMNEEMERIAEYERGQRQDGDKPSRNFLDDPRRSGPAPDTDRKEGSRRHVRNWGGLDFDNVKTGAELEKEWTSRRPGPKGSVDMTMSMTGRERAEYLRWKKEREQIDEERLARHRNATGQWRREWDAQKTDSMFKEDPYVAAEGIPAEGGRRARGHNSRTEPRGRASDDSKRPPKAPTFGDFLSQGRTQGPRGDRSRGRGRGQKQSYSMHDNRWEGEKEEEEKEKEDKTKREEKSKKKEKEEEKAKPPTVQKVEEKNGEGEDDDEWEDASDEECEEVNAAEHDSKGDEKKDVGKEKQAKSKESSPKTPKPRSRQTSAGSPKEQRTPRPKVHIPAPAAAQESPEGGKPLSPFSPLDGHQPVSDWGEEMEMLSPRSSMGGESPLKPSSVDSSPPQKKEEEEQEEAMKSQAAGSNEPAEPQTEEHAEKVESQETQVIASEPTPTDSPAAVPSDPAPCEVKMEQDTPPAQSQEDRTDSPPSPTVLEAESSSSAAAADEDDATAPAESDAAPTAETQPSSEQPSSG